MYKKLSDVKELLPVQECSETEEEKQSYRLRLCSKKSYKSIKQCHVF
ncbi:hypothetical protein [Ehrlichia ruminantium]|nr:hypothetical protein [Ehrlichia ruminantium]